MNKQLLANLYRWTNGCEGGIVYAQSKIEKCVKEGPIDIWKWTNDDYYDPDNTDVINVY